MKIRKYVNPGYVENVVRINYIYAFRKDELRSIQLMLRLLLEGTVTQEKRTSLKRKLLQNYDADINVQGAVVSNVLTLSFEVTGTDRQLLPENETVIKNLTEILMDCINNTNILVKNIDEDKIQKAKQSLLDVREFNKNTIQRVIEESKKLNLNYKDDLDKVTAEDLKRIYIKIITTAKIFAQIKGSSVDEVDKVSDIIKKNICSSSEDEVKVKFKKIIEPMEVETTSHLDSTRVDFVLERKSKVIDAREVALMTVIANIYNDLMFEIVREQYNLSYNPSAVANISENAIILSANVSRENKELAIQLMEYIVSIVQNFDIEEEALYNYMDILYDSIDDENFDLDVYNEALNIKSLTVEDIDDIYYEDLRDHARNYELKIVHYLGGK